MTGPERAQNTAGHQEYVAPCGLLKACQACLAGSFQPLLGYKGLSV